MPLLVEARRVELLSKNPAIQTSPSAVYTFTFPLPTVYKQTDDISSFINTHRCKALPVLWSPVDARH